LGAPGLEFQTWESPNSSTVYNANNQLTQWGSTAMTYDLNGNTLNDGANSYVWDARNRLTSANSNGATFAYDPLGRRVSKTFMSATTNYLYDGANPIQESGTLPTANLLTGGVDERFTRTSSTETDDYLTDALGSTVALTGATGASQVAYSYSPFGSQSATGGTTTNSYTFTGRETDGLGIDYYRARYYNPTVGRFLSEDPMGFTGGGTNFYAYTGDNPTDFDDPFGLKPKNPPTPCAGMGVGCGDSGAAWPMMGMAGFGGPRGNPQFNAGQGGVNPPGPETPPPALKPSGPVEIEEVEDEMQRLVKMLGDALSNLQDLQDLTKEVVPPVVIPCDIINPWGCG
jgi:RHS repeat-associated protein